MHYLIFLSLVVATAFAHRHDPALPRCQNLLGHTVEHLSHQADEITYLQRPGVGNFGMVSSSYPPVNAETEANANRQGIISWFHTLAVAPSVAAAREHDLHLGAHKQVMYLISDRPLDDLQTTESLTKGSVPADVLADRIERGQQRFREIFRDGDTKVVFFQEPKFIPELHFQGDIYLGVRPLYYRGSDTPVPRDLIEIPTEDARRMFHADEMGVTHDDRGTHFRQYGWFRLPRRGIMDFATTFRRASGINPDSSVVKKAWALLKKNAKAGWRFTPNRNHDEVLEMAKRQVHNVNGQRAVGQGEEPNSRYLEQHVEDMTRGQFKAGSGFTREWRDQNGVLRGAGIGFFGPGQMLMMDTVIGDDINIRKAMILEGLIWGHQIGYDMIDTQVVSTTTGPLKAFYISPEEFMHRVYAKPAPPRPDMTSDWILPSLEELHELRKD